MTWIADLPIVTLGGIERRMFKPMAWTVAPALLGSLLLAVTLIPVLASLLLRKTRTIAEGDGRDTSPGSLSSRFPEPQASRCWRGAKQN